MAQDSIEKVSMSSSTNMELVLKRLEIKIDSLSTNIEQLKQERNYFQAALSSETTIFTMIFGAVFSVIGFFSFLIVKIQLHGSEKKVELMINAQKEKFLLIDEINEKHNILVNKALGNVYVTISNIKYDNASKFIHLINAATCFNRINALEIAKINLGNAKKNWAILLKDSVELGKFKKRNIDTVYKCLKELIKSEDTDVINMAVTLFSDITKIM